MKNTAFIALRKKKRFTQKELAERLGGEQVSVSCWETGKTIPKADTMHRIAEVLGCDYQEVEACFETRKCTLARLRSRKNMGQVEFAEVMGVTAQTVSNWERGAVIPDMLTVVKMADELDCTFLEVAECFVKVKK